MIPITAERAAGSCLGRGREHFLVLVGDSVLKKDSGSVFQNVHSPQNWFTGMLFLAQL